MNKILILTAALIISPLAMATNPKPPKTTVVDPIATANQTQSGTNKQGQSQTGGTQTITNNPFITVGGAAAEANGEVRVGQVNPTSESDSNSESLATTGETALTSGVTNNVNPVQNQVNDQKQSIKDSANNSFNYQSYDQNIHRAGLVQNDCNRRSIDATGGKENRFLGIAWTTQNHDCLAVKYAEAVRTMFPEERSWAREVLCTRDVFLVSDAKSSGLCYDNKQAGNNASVQKPSSGSDRLYASKNR